MTIFFIIAFILLVGPLAVAFGVDSRIHEDRPRHW
jgi:hypothetical protein